MERVREGEENVAAPEVRPEKSEPSRPSSNRVGGVAVQKKAVVGAADDEAEREADTIAEQVMRDFSGGTSIDAEAPQPRIRGRVARRVDPTPAPAEGAASRVQRAARPSQTIGPEGGAVDSDTEHAITSARGGGQPLDSRIRGGMERSMQADFSSVRVHVGPESDRLNTQLQAKAFTTGSDIFVRSSDYSPGSASGQRLLAHELAHTVQQGASPPSAGDVQRKLDVRISAHDFAHSVRAGGRLVQRDGDPLSPAVPQSGQSEKFKHYLGEASTPGAFVDLQKGMSPQDAAKYKMAIKELQRKLISSLGGRLKAGILKRDGIFGNSTEGAVKKFQQAHGLGVTGICDLPTWAAIDNDAKAVSARGREEFRWAEDHEEAALKKDGSSGQFGMASAIDWAKKDDELVVNVAYQFDRGPGVDGGSVDVARNAIQAIWNTFHIKYKGPKDPKGKKRKPRNPLIKLTFNPVDAATPPPGGIGIKADQRVFLFKPPHPNAAARKFASADDNKTRSDAGNWNVADPKRLKEIAAHEFGHAIGLEDEYGRRHKDMTRLAGKVESYDKAGTVADVTWFKDRIAAATKFADLKLIGEKTKEIAKGPPEILMVIAQKYRDTYGTKLPDDLQAKMTQIKTSHETKAAQAITDRDATTPLHDAAKLAAENADAAAVVAAKAAAKAEAAYRRRPAIGQVSAALLAVLNATTSSRASADLASPQHDAALAAQAVPHLNRAAGEDRHKRATQAAKASQRLVVKATTAAKAAADAVPGVEAATMGAFVSSKEAMTKTRADQAAARDELTSKKEAADAAREARDAATSARDFAMAIAGRRAQAWGEIGSVNPKTADAAAAADTAAKLADAELQQATDAANAATKAAQLAGKLATSTARTAPIGTAAAAASVAAASAEQSRSAAWDTATQHVAQHVARELSWRRNDQAATDSDSSSETGHNWWAWAHTQGMSTGGLMGRGHGKDVANSPAIDHAHPLEARHVRRYAEFVMKYKPDDIWEPAHR